MRLLHTAEVASSDGPLEADLAVPEATGGPGEATTPERLFPVGCPACFHSAPKGVTVLVAE